MDEWWPGRLFQMLDVAAGNYFEVTIEVFLEVADVVIEV